MPGTLIESKGTEMSSDDAIAVRQKANGKYVAQRISMSSDDLPDVETATKEYGTLDDLIYDWQNDARDTEYGFLVWLENSRRPVIEPRIKYHIIVLDGDTEVVNFRGENVPEHLQRIIRGEGYRRVVKELKDPIPLHESDCTCGVLDRIVHPSHHKVDCPWFNSSERV